MITPEQHAEIRRLYYGEHWKVGTIAAALGVHHDTVRATIVNDTQGVRRSTFDERPASESVTTRSRKSIEYAPAMCASWPPGVPWPRTEYKLKTL